MGDEFGPSPEDMGIDSEGNLTSDKDQKPEGSKTPGANTKTTGKEETSSTDALTSKVEQSEKNQDLQNELERQALKPEEVSYRNVQYGRIYDRLEPNKSINIAAIGNVSIEIDEENLGLENVSVENLLKGWERDKEWFMKRCNDLGIEMDPYEVYKYYQIQKKVFQVLGKPVENTMERTSFAEQGDHAKLSETKNRAMCSEYAILSTYIAQRIGEPVHLIIGSGVESGDEEQWRESHAYVWVDNLNVAFDSVLAKNGDELPALMKPVEPASLKTLEEGFDVSAKRIGSDFTRFYGLTASGFGVQTTQS